MSQNQPGPADVRIALERAQDAVRDALSTAADTQVSSALVVNGADSAVAVKAQMAAARARVALAHKGALEAQASAKEAIRRQQDELAQAMWAMDKELAPLLAQVALLAEGIATINLYLGRDEEIVTLTSGAPALAATPVHVRQQVLAMDEESALNAGIGGIDVRNIAAFDQWITSDPANLEQVLPEQRGVVAIMARREYRDYGDPWANQHLNAQNRETWWLIRNGENLYRMLTDFNVGRRLVPARNEFTSMFVDPYSKKPLEPGSRDWLKAEERAGARERHFMKIALILQGLIDRTAVFAPLPVAGLSLLRPDHYDAGHVVLIADDENQITSGRTPFREWLSAKNAQLTPGMRVIVNTLHEDWPTAGRYDEHPRIHPSRAEYPRSTAVHVIKKRVGGGDLSFTYPRTREEWLSDGRGRETLRLPSTAASCTISASDAFVLPIDLVTVAEMRDYLAARTERHAYASMFPTLNAAIAFKLAEAVQERPFRDLLAAQVAQAEDIDQVAAAELVDPLVDWWKVGNRWHRALSGEPAAEAKAARAILAERSRLARAGGPDSRDARVVAQVLAAHPDALLIARRKDGTYVALTPHERRWALPTDTAHNAYGDQVAPLDVWVARRDFTTTGKAKGVQGWVIPAPATVSRWIALYSSQAWASWNRRAVVADHLTDPEIAAAAEALATAHTPKGWVAVAVLYDESGRSSRTGFDVYAYRPETVSEPTDRPLTQGRTRLPVGRFTCSWKRERDGSITLTPHVYQGGIGSDQHPWSTRPAYQGNGQGSGFGRRDDGRLTPPWQCDRRALTIVRLDEDAYEAAHAQALADAAARQADEAPTTLVRELTRALEAAAIERITAAAKARFLEDYVDETLWADHAKSLQLVAPWRRSPVAKGYQGVEGGLRWLTARLVESGRHPYGLSVAEAVTLLGEPIVDRPEYGHQSGAQLVFPEGVLALRYPDAPANAGVLEP